MITKVLIIDCENNNPITVIATKFDALTADEASILIDSKYQSSTVLMYPIACNTVSDNSEFWDGRNSSNLRTVHRYLSENFDELSSGEVISIHNLPLKYFRKM